MKSTELVAGNSYIYSSGITYEILFTNKEGCLYKRERGGFNPVWIPHSADLNGVWKAVPKKIKKWSFCYSIKNCWYSSVYNTLESADESRKEFLGDGRTVTAIKELEWDEPTPTTNN